MSSGGATDRTAWGNASGVDRDAGVLVIEEYVGLTDPLDAELAFATSLLARRIGEIDPTLRRRHFEGKHGPVAYYGHDNPTVPA